ncbi:MAG TPA: hypothetical protein VIR04_03230 [Paralcaligenes sp.]|jgi:hypothetical protein
MNKNISIIERPERIELARARAALERQSLERGIRNLEESLKPATLFRGLLPKSVAQSGSLGWLGQGLLLTQRYPLLASGASALISGLGKRHRWLRLGAGLLLGWQLARSGVLKKKPG